MHRQPSPTAFRFSLIAAVSLAGVGGGLIALAQKSDTKPGVPKHLTEFGPRAQVLLTASSVNVMLTSPQREKWAGTANHDRARGHEALYAKVAPAVVAVRTMTGHGTGFFISQDGLLITNLHVVDAGTGLDVPTQGSTAQVHMGKLSPDGTMTTLDKALTAHVLAIDPVHDLALLKLTEMPEGMSEVPFLPLADKGPAPGQTCAIVGNPSSGMLWTFRVGGVASVGTQPKDMIDAVLLRLATQPRDRAELEKSFDVAESCKIILSSCHATNGDSGGPCVNENGEVIAVTNAIPSTSRDDKFTYHIHLDELKAFLGRAARTPMVLLPDPFRVGPVVELHDVLTEGRPTALLAGTDKPAQFLFDLDGDTPPASYADGNLRPLVTQRAFEAEFAFHTGPHSRTTFYDTDNDGTFDVILIAYGESPGANIAYRLDAEKRWSQQLDSGETLINPDLMKDALLSKRLALLAERM